MKKIFLAVSALCVSIILLQCKKTESHQQKESSGYNKPTELILAGSQATQRKASPDEVKQVNSFFDSKYWGVFKTDNANIDKYKDSLNLDIVTYTDKSSKSDIILIKFPILSSNHENVFIAGLQSDFNSGDFNKMYILYSNLDKISYNQDNLPYGSSYTEIYNNYGQIHTVSTLMNDELSATYSLDSTYTYLNGGKLAGPVLPTVACLNASYDNLVADEGGSLAHSIKNFLTGGALDAADWATAVICCSLHNNQPWMAP